MADSDGEYIQELTDEEEADLNLNGSSSRSGNAGGSSGTYSYGTRAAKGKERSKTTAAKAPSGRAKEQRWEGSIQKTFAAATPLLSEGADGMITGSVEGMLAARKRKRLEQRDTTPLQRGIIRHLLLILDLSEAMLEKDMRPNRYLVTLKYAQDYVREFFEQNPISQMGIMGMHDGVCVRISDLSGNPNDHISALQAVRDPRNPREPKGSPSLQNALEMARASLYHTPSHGTREVIIVLGALLSLDPDDIHKTIKSCVRDKLRVGIIGMAGRLKICQEICTRTNSGDDSAYGVALDQPHFRELLMATTTPPVIRAENVPSAASSERLSAPGSSASLLMMGFPSRVVETAPSLCACHGTPSRGGYLCPRCSAKVCNLPATCPACALTLILSTHLARSYHHLFPLRGWVEVSWARARQIGSTQCKGCMSPFPATPAPSKTPAVRKESATTGQDDSVKAGKAKVGGHDNDSATDGSTAAAGPLPVKVLGASESSRYECESCHNHFCIDCDVFCHEVAHNCPGCLSGMDDGLVGIDPDPENAHGTTTLQNGVNGVESRIDGAGLSKGTEDAMELG